MGNGPSFHVFPRDPGKDAVRGPQNCPRNSSEAKSSKVFVFFEVRGLHLSPEVPRTNVESYHYTMVMPFSEQGCSDQSDFSIFSIFSRGGLEVTQILYLL